MFGQHKSKTDELETVCFHFEQGSDLLSYRLHFNIFNMALLGLGLGPVGGFQTTCKVALDSLNWSKRGNCLGSATAHQSSKDMDDLLRNLTSLMKDATPQDLQQLGNNEDRINELIKDSEQTKQLQRRRTALTERNKDLAVTNISMRPEFDLLKDKLIELTQEQNTLLEQYSLLQSEISGLVSLDTTLALLQASCAEKEAESERVSEALLDQEKSVDEFIEEFMPLRKDYHLRKIKSDKFSVVLNERNRPTPAPRQRFGNYQSSYGGY